jgi:hypothetical protein
MQSSINHQQDPANPWENLPGDLTVRFFFEGVGTDRRIFRCGPEVAALPGTVYLLGRRAPACLDLKERYNLNKMI